MRRIGVGSVHSDGGIAQGTQNRIAGGVFVGSGAFVAQVHNHGPVTTYGPNDMVLDNWGSVDEWTVDDRLTSFGPERHWLRQLRCPWPAEDRCPHRDIRARRARIQRV